MFCYWNLLFNVLSVFMPLPNVVWPEAYPGTVFVLFLRASVRPCVHPEMLTRFLVLLCAGGDGDAEADENTVQVIPVILCSVLTIFLQLSITFILIKLLKTTADTKTTVFSLKTKTVGSRPHPWFEMTSSSSSSSCIGNNGINSNIKVKKVKGGNTSKSCGESVAVWDHTVLPATRHKWTHPEPRRISA